MKPPPLRLGALVIETPTVLAPMAGLTDLPFRLLCARHRCGLVMTEVVSADSVVRMNAATMHYLEACPEERPVGAQLYGSDPSVLADAAQRVEALGRFDLIDINCGCPVPKIISKGAGVALMKQPERINAMIRAIRAAVKLPVTAKTRIGLSPEKVSISEVAQSIEEGGAQMLAIHARFACAKHSGPADWDALARIKAERTIPIVGNGGINRAADALAMQAHTGVDGVMIGRAAIGNPWIFDEIHALWNGTAFTPPDLDEKHRVIEQHLHHLIGHFAKKNTQRRRKKTPYSAETAACRHFRTHLLKYLRGYPGISTLMRRMDSIQTVGDVMTAIDDVLGPLRAA
jgi:nifR3 family TIM-barrel protein